MEAMSVPRRKPIAATLSLLSQAVVSLRVEYRIK